MCDLFGIVVDGLFVVGVVVDVVVEGGDFVIEY